MSASCFEGPDGASFNVVKHCCDAWNRALDLAKSKHKDHDDAVDAAIEAYRRAMPFLVGNDNIRGFIAAVAQGLLLDVFTQKESTTLIYIAQVALGALPRELRPAGRPRKDPAPQPATGDGKTTADGDSSHSGETTISSILACIQESSCEESGSGVDRKINTPHPPCPSQNRNVSATTASNLSSRAARRQPGSSEPMAANPSSALNAVNGKKVLNTFANPSCRYMAQKGRVHP